MYWLDKQAMVRLYFTKSYQSIKSIILFLPELAYIENKFDSSGQKKKTMAKQYTLIHAHGKDLV